MNIIMQELKLGTINYPVEECKMANAAKKRKAATLIVSEQLNKSDI